MAVVHLLPVAAGRPPRDPARAFHTAQRATLRHFLRYCPERAATERYHLVVADGTTRSLTRASLTAAIARLPMRQRRVVAIMVEQKQSHTRVAHQLHDCSIRTIENDARKALDALLALVLEEGLPC
jgi:hypothetical protein